MTLPLFLLTGAGFPADSPVDRQASSSAEAGFSRDSLSEGMTFLLPASVRRHAVKAMRLGQGDGLLLSDGRGLKVQARITDPQAGAVMVEKIGLEPAPAVKLGLIQALAKSGRDEQAIEMATAIGIDRVIPWQAQRSIVLWKGSKAGKGREKWRDQLIAATEQSRRSWLPQLDPVMNSKQLAAWISQVVGFGDTVIVLHQDASESWGSISDRLAEKYRMAIETAGQGETRGEEAPTIFVIVGPEGGISDEEIGLFKEAGATLALIGRNILRASSAGPVALTLLTRIIGRIQ